jgi:DNA replication protein DnaC
LNLQLPPNPDACRLLTDPEFERLKKSGATQWLQPKRGCLTCGDHRKFTGTGPDALIYDCDCVAQWILYHWMLNAGVNQEYQRLAWSDMTDVDVPAKKAIFGYLANLEYNVRTGRGLILWSKVPGTGKTLLSSLLIKQALAEGYDCYFTQFNEMIDIFTAGWREEEERAWFIKRIRNVPILAVDDIGKEAGGRSNVVDSMFDTVMRHRVASGKPTIITTNLNPDEMRQGYGLYVMSLLTEQCSMVEVPGSDYRPTAAIEKAANAEAKAVRPFVAGVGA